MTKVDPAILESPGAYDIDAIWAVCLALGTTPAGWPGAAEKQKSRVTNMEPEKAISQTRDFSRETYKRPPMPTQFRCPAFGAKVVRRRCAGGNGGLLPLPCGACSECYGAWRWGKGVRYTEGVRRRLKQTLVILDDLDDDAQAAEVREYVGNRLRCLRVGILSRGENYLWRAVVVTADALDSHDVDLLQRALARRYPGKTATVQTRGVRPGEIEDWLPGRNMTAGNHKPVVFSPGWIRPEQDATAWLQFNDGIVEDVPTDQPMVTEAKHVCPKCDNLGLMFPLEGPDAKAHREVHALVYANNWLSECLINYHALAALVDVVDKGDRVAVGQAVGNMVAVGQYDGPSRLWRELARALCYDGLAVQPNNPFGLRLNANAEAWHYLAMSYVVWP